MRTSVTLTYDLTSATTRTDDGRTVSTCREPFGILGLCSAGYLWSLTGADLTIRVVRSRVAAGARS